MYQYDDPTCIATIPTPAAAGTPGYFTNGAPASGLAATILGADFMNTLMMELLSLVAAGGLTPSKTNNAQVLAALKVLFAPLAGNATQQFLVAAATAAGQAVNLGQAQLSFSGAQLGGTRRMSAIAAANATSTTFTDERVLVSTPAGQNYLLTGFSQLLTLATVGIGGMDTGTATANRYIAVYAAYNPTTATQGIFATLESTSVVASTMYSGANAPSGFTATALIAVVRITSTAGQFLGFILSGKSHGISLVSLASGTTSSTSTAYISTAVGVPYSARKLLYVSGSLSVPSGSIAGVVTASPQAGPLGGLACSLTAAQATNTNVGMGDLIITTPGTYYLQAYSSTAGTAISYGLSCTGYEI